MSGFVHLHVHSQYSLLDGAGRIKDLVSSAAKLGMPAIALTDHGNMYGAVEFYKAAKARGIKPIIGCEVYVAPGSRFDKKTSDNERYYGIQEVAGSIPTTSTTVKSKLRSTSLRSFFHAYTQTNTQTEKNWSQQKQAMR